MLTKVNSLMYKAKINVKIKPKIKITYVLILVSGKIEQENCLKAGSSNGLSSKFAPTMKCYTSESINSPIP